MSPAAAALAALAAIAASLPLAAGALLAARAFSRAAVRYRIVAAAFVLAAAVAPLAFLVARFRPAAPVPAALEAALGGAAPASLAAPVLALATIVAAMLLLDLAFDVVRLRRVKRGATELARLGVRRARLGTSRAVTTPTAIGYVHPAVLLPEGFAARVDEREWDAIVAHECAHLTRLDDWAKALQSAVLRAAWWLPGLWLLGRALDLERELASDERAAGSTGARRYAACLLRLATDRGTDALAPAFGARRSHVAIRVERLLRPVRGGGPLLRAAALGAFTAAAFGIVGAAVLAVPGTASSPPALAHGARRPGLPVAERVRHPGQLTAGRSVALAGARLPVARAASTSAETTALRAAAQRTGDEIARADRAAAAALASGARPAAASARRAHAASPALRGAFALAPAAVRGEAAGRTPARRRPRSVRVVLAPETLALANVPHRRCETCFGPLRTADETVSTQTVALAPQGGSPSGGSAAIAADDPTAGPVSLTNQMLWFRLPAKVMQRP